MKFYKRWQTNWIRFLLNTETWERSFGMPKCLLVWQIWDYVRISHPAPCDSMLALISLYWLLEPPASSRLDGEADEGWSRLDPPYRHPSANIFWRIKLSHLQSQPHCDREKETSRLRKLGSRKWKTKQNIFFPFYLCWEGGGGVLGEVEVIQACPQPYMHLASFSLECPITVSHFVFNSISRDYDCHWLNDSQIWNKELG